MDTKFTERDLDLMKEMNEELYSKGSINDEVYVQMKDAIQREREKLKNPKK